MSNITWLPECLHWPFCPGVFIAILAFTAAAVTFRKDPSPREKAIWIFVFLGLMSAEVWMMSKDRTENNRKQKETRDAEIASFQAIGERIETAIKESQNQFSATMKSQKQTFNWISGGEAYVTVMVDLRTLQLEVITQGPQPLRDVYLNIFDMTHVRENPTQVFETAKIVSVGTVYPTVLRHLDYQLPVTGDSASFQINIYQPNGFFTEHMNLVKQNNSWKVKSTELYRNKDGKRLIP